MPKNWIVVASAEHAAIGLAHGFMQACHGRAAPLRRMRPGDRVLCYSPTQRFREKDPCRAFTAIGTLRDRDAYQADMGNGFTPFRRDVAWLAAREAPIAPLLETLELTAGRRNWGYKFRFGLFEITASDTATIATAMGAELSG